MKDIDFQALLASAYGQQAPVSGAGAQNYFDALGQNNTQFMPGFQSAIANQLAYAFGNGLPLGPNPQPTPPPIPPTTDPPPPPVPPLGQPPAATQQPTNPYTNPYWSWVYGGDNR